MSAEQICAEISHDDSLASARIMLRRRKHWELGYNGRVKTVTELVVRLFRGRTSNLQVTNELRNYGLFEDPNSKAELERRLDRALEETFPASDPISIMISVGPKSAFAEL
jgi:hypothetical protein